MNATITTILAAAGVLALSIPAHAGSLNWSGDVDDTATIAISGRSIRTTANADGIRSERRDMRGVLPRDDVRVRLDRHDGRGSIRIIQQPSRRNNYTTLVRIEDKARGRDHYRFSLEWNDRDTRNDNGRGRARDHNSRPQWDRHR